MARLVPKRPRTPEEEARFEAELAELSRRDEARRREDEERWAREREEWDRAYREEQRIVMRLTETEMCQREAYFKLKKEVHVLATRVAESVVLDSRSYSLWLVQVKGFPWRDECKWKDLKRLKRYLLSPEAREEVAAITQAPPPRRGGGPSSTEQMTCRRSSAPPAGRKGLRVCSPGASAYVQDAPARVVGSQ
jgi:hypothetical protein